MPLSNDDLFNTAYRLSAEEKLKVAVSASLTSGLIVGTCAVAGGLIGGPIGIAVGSTVGGCLQAVRTSGQFQSVPEILSDMTPAQRQALVDSLRAVIENYDVTDVTQLMAMVLAGGDLKITLINAVVSYLRNEMRMNVCD